VFWSGGPKARAAAEAYAKANGLKTLEMTWQGKSLEKLTKMLDKIYGPGAGYKILKPWWDKASRGYARAGKEGDAFLNNPKPDSTYRRIEEPEASNQGYKPKEHDVSKK